MNRPAENALLDASSHQTNERCRRELLFGLLNHGLKFGEGVDRSGNPCSWLLDARETLLKAPYLHYAAKLLWDKLKPYRPDVVAGMSIGADPLIIAVMYEARLDGHPLDGVMVRKEAKENGLQKQVEGPPLRPGARVVLVDDLVNSGRTQKDLVKILIPYRPNIVACGVIVDYQREGGEWLRAQGIPLVNIFTLADLGVVSRAPRGVDAGALAWSFGPLNTGEYGAPKSAPCIVGDRVFVGSDAGFVICVGTDGRERWRYHVRDRQRGVHSSPCYFDGKVYFGAYDGWLYCVDALTGSLVWEVQPGNWIGSSPTVDPKARRIFVGVEFGKAGGKLEAFDANTGRSLWSLGANNYIHSSPFFDAPRNQVIVGANDGCLYAADATTGRHRWVLQTGGEIKGNPVVDGDGNVFTGSFDGLLYCCSAQTGEVRWKRRLSRRLYTNPFVWRDLVIVGGYSARICGVERATGNLRWINATNDRILGGAAVIRDRWIAFTSTDGTVRIVDGENGELLWRYKTGAAVMTTPAVGAGLLVVPSNDGKLYAFSTTKAG